MLYDLEVRIVIPWHILSRSDFAVFGLGLVKHPAEILVCRVVGTVIRAFALSLQLCLII